MREKMQLLEPYLSAELFDSLSHFSNEKLANLQEIRLRLERDCSISLGSKNEVLINYKTGKRISCNGHQMQNCFKRICENSLYKYENEIKNGYITIDGGCRVGFCGSRTENGFLKDISSISIRLSREINGAASELFPLLSENGVVKSSLIVGPPCAGKTTILTDIARRFSEINLRVSIVDERSEIAAVQNGIPRKNVGGMCDVLDKYPKGEGMMIALRSLSPQLIICDEIGTKSDVEAMLQAMNAGVPVIGSAHANDAVQLLNRPQIKYLIENGGIDQCFFLKGANYPGELKSRMSIEELYEVCSNRVNRF